MTPTISQAAESYAKSTRENLDGTPYLDPHVVTDFIAGAKYILGREDISNAKEALQYVQSQFDNGTLNVHAPAYSIVSETLAALENLMDEIEPTTKEKS